MPKKKLPIKKSANLRELAEKGVEHAALRKDGSYEARKGKKGATHKIKAEAGSVLAEPLSKKADKAMKAAAASYGPPRFENEPPRPASEAWHGPIPAGASHAEYATSLVAIVVPLHLVDDFKDFRGGKLRFGRLRYESEFVSLMPGEEGEKTEGKQVVVREGEPSPAAGNTTPPAPAARPAKPAPVRKPDQPGLFQNGVRKPGAGGKTARIWEICDELFAQYGQRVPTKAEVLAAAPKDANPGMVGTNYSYWKRFYGRA